MTTRVEAPPIGSVQGARAETRISADARLTAAVLGYACAAAATARLVYLWQPLRSDEGGYLLVARHWESGAEFLYGDFHVDRPPLLLAIFRLAALSEWDRAIRLLTIPFAIAAILALARAGFLAAGWRGARWSAVVAAALVSSPALAADQADGELFAVPFVAGSVALALDAWRRQSGGQLVCALSAGVLAGTASLVKQSFLEGLVFVGLLVVAETMRRRRLTRRCLVLALGTVAGAAVPNVAAHVWAAGTGADTTWIWTDLFAFRGAAWAVIWEGSFQAPSARAATLVVLALVSGMVSLAWAWIGWARARRGHRAPQDWAVTGSMVFGVWAMAAGGSYWPHYLLQLTPVLALAAGMVAAADGPAGAGMRRSARAAAASAVAACVVLSLVYATVPYVWYQERTGRWLAASSRPEDTAFVAYGNPSVLEAADIASPYPYLWSLPMRTLDPFQQRLLKTLSGPRAPTWIVQVNHLNSWDVDPHERLRHLVAARYDEVAQVCGHTVLLRSDARRQLAPLPNCEPLR